MSLIKEYFSVRNQKLLFSICVILSITKSVANALMLYHIAVIVNTIVANGNWQAALALLVTDYAVFAASNVLYSYIWRRMGHLTYVELYNRVVDKTLSHDYEVFTSQGEGRVHNVIEKVNAASHAGKAGMQLLQAAITFTTMIVAIVKIHSDLLVPILVIYAACAFPLYWLNQRIGKCDEKTTEISKKRSDAMQRLVAGFAELRACNMQAYHRDTIRNYNSENNVWYRRKTIAISTYIAVLEVVDAIVCVLIVILAVSAIPKGLQPSFAITLVSYGWSLMDPLSMVIDCFDEFSTYRKEFNVYKDYMGKESHIDDGTIELTTPVNNISFRDVSFTYDKSEQVLQNVSFNIKRGEKVGIVGQSGCGKTTLLKLIERFYDVSDGSLEIDGIDIRDLQIASLREQIGYISQDPFIFNGSILENVLYGLKGYITMGAVFAACQKAAIYDFIMSLPDQFQTNIGPNGLKLSGGQKERLALARIFVRNPDIILLDEATAALDNESENVVQEALAEMDGKTIVAIAHRLTTIKDFDRILVFEDHKLVESGTHDVLLSQDGVYARLWNSKNK